MWWPLLPWSLFTNCQQTRKGVTVGNVVHWMQHKVCMSLVPRTPLAGACWGSGSRGKVKLSVHLCSQQEEYTRFKVRPWQEPKTDTCPSLDLAEVLLSTAAADNWCWGVLLTELGLHQTFGHLCLSLVCHHDGPIDSSGHGVDVRHGVVMHSWESQWLGMEAWGSGLKGQPVPPGDVEAGLGCLKTCLEKMVKTWVWWCIS